MKSKIKWVIQKTPAGNKTLIGLTNAVIKSGAVFELIELT